MRCYDAYMRTTLSIADDILRDLRALAHAQGKSVTETANGVLRAGLAALAEPGRKRRHFEEEPIDMGIPRVDLTKALALAAEIEDEEVVRKMQLRK